MHKYNPLYMHKLNQHVLAPESSRKFRLNSTGYKPAWLLHKQVKKIKIYITWRLKLMVTVTLGKTGIMVNKNGFGALPVQRVTTEDAVYLLQKAFYNGMTFFDTARFYTDSEKKLGEAFSHIRERRYIATKKQALVI